MSDEDRTELEAEAAALAEANHDDTGKAADDSPPPGVLVIKVKDEEGNIGADAVPVGGVEPTEVLTLLEMAYSNFRAKVGLPPR